MISLVIEGRPPAKNASRRSRVIAATSERKAFARRFLTKRLVAWREELAAVWLASRQPPITAGTWVLHIRSFWPTLRHLGDVSVPNGDFDAPIEAVSDALQACAAIDDDARIVAHTITKHHDRARPRVEIQLLKWEAK
jgi:Holliday junction resolvase RusA-like endonuclease